MSESKRNWINIGIGAFIIIAILLLIALILPLSNLAVEQNEIAVISVNGIVSYSGSNTTKLYTNASEIESAIREANSNNDIKAIVLDINSRGGSLSASEDICELIKSSSKPIISYIGDKGLDESYLIATSSNYIIANPSASVGGIGFSYMNTNKYSTEKLTGHFNTKYLNPNIINNNSKMKNAQNMIDQEYTQFIKEIGENRDLKADYLGNFTIGQKFSGIEAKNLRLIDDTGTKNKAIEKAANLADLTNYTVKEIPSQNRKLTEILDENNLFGLNN